MAQFPYHTLRIDTPRLVLRPMEPSDLTVAVGYYQNPEFRRGMEEDWLRPIDLRELQEIAEVMARQGFLLTIVERANDRPVGEACLQWMNLDRARVRPGEKVMRLPIGIWDKRLWRQGYGRETVQHLMAHAFGKLRIDRLCAMSVSCDNVRSLGLFKACGLRVVRNVTDGLGPQVDLEITAAEYAHRMTA